MGKTKDLRAMTIDELASLTKIQEVAEQHIMHMQ